MHPAPMAYGMFWDEDGKPLPYPPIMVPMRPPRGHYGRQGSNEMHPQVWRDGSEMALATGW
jgi:hypothetical protein